MASLALSVVGTAIAGPLGGAVGGAIGGMIDNLLFPSHKAPLPTITTSTYGNAICRYYGPKNRAGANMIWSSGFRLVQNKSLKFLAGKGGSAAQAQTYVADIAMAVGGGPLQSSWCKKIWANGTVIFDATAGTGQPTPDANGVVTWDVSFLTFQDFDTIVVYPGNFTQLPDPTSEAHLGAGNVPGYRGTAYVLINGLKLTTFGNAIPTLNILVQQAETTTLAEIVIDICGRAGLDTNTISTSALTHSVDGYTVAAQTDCATALQPLALCYNFDFAEVAGGLRCVPRGEGAYATIESAAMAGHPYGESQPDAFAWPRGPETQTPRSAVLTFKDPARDLNDNTQSAKRVTGSAQSDLSNNVTITLSSDDARKICDRMLWEAQIGRQAFSAPMTDRMVFLECGRVFAIESPAGHENVRITRVARGVNGVIEIEGKRDYSALYFSSAPGADSTMQANPLAIAGPVNAPLFIEPPSTFPGITGPTLFIAVSGGDGVIANDAWTGCSVFASTDNANFTLIGSVVQPSLMGKLTNNLPGFGGSNPQTIVPLDIDTRESGQEPATISAYDAEVATAPYWLNGEFLTAETSTGLGGGVYQLENLWRGLYGTGRGSHSIGDPICRIDHATFRFPLPVAYIGATVYFKFVSNGESLATVTTYTHTAQGSGYGSASGGLPGAVSAVAASPSAAYVNIAATPNPLLDNVTSYNVYRAPGLGASFGSAALVAAGVGQSYTDPTVAPSTPYTYFTTANNQVGESAPSPGESVTTTAGSGHAIVQATYSSGDISTAALGAVIGRVPSGFSWTFPATTSTPAGYCEGEVDTAPSAQTDFDLLKDGVSVGTARWAASSRTPVLIKASDTAFATGDYLDVKTPGNLNGMAGAWGLALIGFR